jgi:hypothetical protein
MPYVFRHGYARITTRRFPHSEIPGSKVGQHLPQAYRSRPRPSSALGAKASTVCSYSLDQKEHVCDVAMEFSRCTRAWRFPKRELAGQSRSLKTQQRTWTHVEVDVFPGELGVRTAEAIDNPSSHRGNCPGIPRKEVIQPQLPLRLPCYDFTPVIDPTFDGSLPCGLGHRLRVLPTSVV